jgi:hypothetical protein
MEKFAERYTEQNPDVFPTPDVAFILAFSIIMLNTDLHNPAIKDDRRMTREGFVRNNRGIADGQDLPTELLTSIFDRIKTNPISLKEDDEAREKRVDGAGNLPSALSPAAFFSSHYDEMDRARDANFQKERDHIVRTTESLLKRRRHGHDQAKTSKTRGGTGKVKSGSKYVMTDDSGLRDEYVSPMFDVAWGPALAAFSTAMESANGTVGALISIASDEELELAAENAAETIEVCLTGFRFAICTAGLCGNSVARDAFMHALSRFSQLGTGVLLELRHVRCIQTLMGLAREDGELLSGSWEFVFRALSEINRFHQIFHLMARNDRKAAVATERRQKKLDERERRRRAREERKAALEDGESVGEPMEEEPSDSEDSLADSNLFSDDEDYFEDDMDAKEIDEANARVVYDAVSESTIEAIYERSSTFSATAVKDFVRQLCFVSRNEIACGGQGAKDLNQVTYRQQHALLYNNAAGDQFHHRQTNIYNLQKLVEVTHYNMESRPRMIFSELWTIVADHLVNTALHSNPAIAMYAVDSFRQLSIQYLQRDELEAFEFQRRFLKPLDQVMARSDQTSTKELLLNCVDRIIQVFRADEPDDGDKITSSRKGGLKSGWVPILSILGLAGKDSNESICEASFKILTDEVNSCLDNKAHVSLLLSEYFVDTISAFMMFVSGPHDVYSIQSMDYLTRLAGFLADDDVAQPLPHRRRASIISAASVAAASDPNDDLELWWPILLGLSGSVGDGRPAVRAKSLETLIKIIEIYFFPSTTKSKGQHDIQTLQIVFRGVLFPILEFAEFDSHECASPSLPEDFDRFLTKQAPVQDTKSNDEVAYTGWLDTMFDAFVDACVSLCLRSINIFKDNSLIEEIFALLNNCLNSDSGRIACRGLQRLEQFVTSDLSANSLTDDVWATVSHMLRQCLSVRSLPPQPSRKAAPAEAQGSSDLLANGISPEEENYAEAVQEFVIEDNFLSERRYVGSNATMVIGMLLSSERFTIGLRWRLFLIAGLGRGIVDWERAASILSVTEGSTRYTNGSRVPPDYLEASLYGRKWMNRFLLQLAAVKEIAQAPADADTKSDRFAMGQKLVMDETQRLLAAFLKRENIASHSHHTETEEALHIRYTNLVKELMAGYNKMDTRHLQDLAWINPILLGTCIQSKNEDVRLAVQKLVQRTQEAPTPYPSPMPKEQAINVENNAPATKEEPQTANDLDEQELSSAAAAAEQKVVAPLAAVDASLPHDDTTRIATEERVEAVTEESVTVD